MQKINFIIPKSLTICKSIEIKVYFISPTKLINTNLSVKIFEFL